jgi:hypothetical protein
MKTQRVATVRRPRKRYVYRSARALFLKQVGDPADIPVTLLGYVTPLEEFARAHPGAWVIIFVRESGRNQWWRQHARNQLASVVKAVEALGLKVHSQCLRRRIPPPRRCKLKSRPGNPIATTAAHRSTGASPPTTHESNSLASLRNYKRYGILAGNSDILEEKLEKFSGYPQLRNH